MRISPTWECLEYIVTVVWYDSKEDTFEKVIEKKTLLWQRLHETESSLWYQRYMQQNAKKNNWKDRKLWWRKILGYCTWFFSNYMKSIILLFKAILDKKSVWTMKRMTREREKRPLTMSYNGKRYQFPQANCRQKYKH